MTIIAIVGIVATIIGTIVSIVAYRYTKRSDEKRKATELSAKQAADAAEQRMLTYMASASFAAAARMAYELVLVLRSGNWLSAAELAADMASELGQVKGAWLNELDAAEVKDVQRVEASVDHWLRLIPITADGASNETNIQIISDECMLAIKTMRTISARLNHQVLQRSGDK